MVTRTRLSNAERRAQLVAVGVELLRSRPLDQLALEDVATAAGISRALPFHYFATRRDFLVAVVEAAAGELLDAVRTPVDLPAVHRLRAGLEGYVGFIQQNPAAYVAVVRGAAGAHADLAAVCDRTRDAIVDNLLEGVSMVSDAPDRTAGDSALRLAVRGWVGFVEEAAVAWLKEPAVARDELVWLLESALVGAVGAVAQRHGLPLSLALEDK